MKGVIESQQKAHSKIVGAIDRSLPKIKGETQKHQRSQGYKRPKDATESSFIARSAWMKTVKLLEDVEQLQGEGKRLAQQVSPYDPWRCPPCATASRYRAYRVNNVLTQLQTVQLVDIKVEDQGKAVMVFTIVTVIFLPLSFVSSYFGMNTAGRGQWTFWAVGLSVTFSTVVVALLVAFRGQRWKRRWNEKYLWDKERGMKVQ